MRKLEPCYENPFDNIIINLCEQQAPLFYKLNFTPNMITTLSLIFGLLAAYLFYKNQSIVAACIFIISYYFDCLDGFYARKYNMTSKFGDYYDHICDVTKTGLILFLMYRKNHRLFYKIIPILLILLFLLSVHIGCQESYYVKKYNKEYGSLSYFSLFYPKEPEQWLPYSRYGGMGTATFVFAGLMCLFK